MATSDEGILELLIWRSALVTAPSISIIIPVYSNLRALDHCLQSFEQNELCHLSEVIVIDDCSPEAKEAVEDVVLKYKASYYRRAENAGPGVARNYGASLARGDILVFIDSDCVTPAGWLSKLTQPIYDGKCLATTSCYSSPINESWITSFQNEDYLYRMPTIVCDTYFVNSCNLAINRDIFFDCGGFPKQRTSEDMVLGMRLAINGTPARYLPDAGVQHEYYMDMTSYLRQRYSFALNTIRSYLDLYNNRSAKVNNKVRSFNPTRTALGICFNFLAVVSLIFAGITGALNLDLVVIFLILGFASLLLETTVHGRFLLLLIKRQGLGRTVSYTFLLYIIDTVYMLAIVRGLVGASYKLLAGN